MGKRKPIDIDELYNEISNITFRTDTGREVVPVDRLAGIINGLIAKEEENIQDKISSKDHESYIESLTLDKNLYVSLQELTDRFIDIDNEFDHELWDLHQILANFMMLTRTSLNSWYFCDDKLPECHLTYDIFKRPDKYVSDPVLVVMKSEEVDGTKYIVNIDLMTGSSPNDIHWLMSCGYGGSAVGKQEIIAWRPLPVFDPNNVIRYKEE